MATMKALVQDVYGPDVLELREIDVPTCDDDRVLVRVAAASVNPVDWHAMTGLPLITRPQEGLRRPKHRVRGVDVAGTIIAIGRDVTTFRVGDEVFGTARGSFAEFACAGPAFIVTKPESISFEHAAAIPVAALTALQALRDKGRLQRGQRVLINGAAGGVGTFAVQIAKALGAQVTAVCSAGNVEMVRSLGADEVIDYTTADFVMGGRRFDVMVDNVGNRSLAECRRVLERKGIYVVVGGPKKGRILGPARRMLSAVVTFPFTRQKAAPFVAKINPADLIVMAELVTSGQVTPVIERTYSLAEGADAMRYLGGGHAKGKLVITM
jgi:NADPH:quinone reductase-like Zn-dependent oxidoreductase